MKKRKVVVLGWDAADWEVIMPLVESGKMPASKKLMEKSAYGNISTMDPPLSPMLWTSIATGKRAYEHGILGFVESTEDGMGVRPVQGSSRKVKALWNIFTQKGLKSNVVGWWPSFPAEPINGVMVSNNFQLVTAKATEWKVPTGSVYPQELEDVLAEWRVHSSELTGNHLLPFIPKLKELGDISENKLVQFTIKNIAETTSLHSTFTYLLENTDWDFSALYLDGIDHFCHLAMKFYPPKPEWVPEEQFAYYKDIVEAGYRFHDMMLDRIMDMVGEDTTIILLSDHGFKSGKDRLQFIPKEPAGPAYEHRQYGVVLFSGPGIKKGEQIHGATLLDMAPTILQLYGLPVGQDMPGRVLQSIFEAPQEVQYISSWEDVPGYSGMGASLPIGESITEAEAMNQLIELGYVERPEEEDEKVNVSNAFYESQYYLARSLMDGKRYVEAMEILKDINHLRPGVYRYLMRQYSCAMALNDWAVAKSSLHQAEEAQKVKSPKIKIYEASIEANSGNYLRATELLNSLLDAGLESALLYNEMGKVFQATKDWQGGVQAYNKALELEPDHVQALSGLGHCLMQLDRLEEAAEAFIDSTSLLHFQPRIHYLLGNTLSKLGYDEAALNAFELALNQAPLLHAARQKAIELYEKMGKAERVVAHREELALLTEEPIVVVSGLPRTGTSMMMQMLEAAGLQPLTDEIRKADQSNPKGYYELEKVKSLAKDNTWLGEAQGKVVKIIAQLIPNLPKKHRYKVIFMERPLHEVILSQEVMLGKSKESTLRNFPLHLANQYQGQLDRIKQFMANRANIDTLFVHYGDVINNPSEVAASLSRFLGKELDLQAMQGAVDKKLVRNKLV